MDPYCSLPALSTYMGHKGIESTEYYLRLTKQYFVNVLNYTQEQADTIFSGGVMMNSLTSNITMFLPTIFQTQLDIQKIQSNLIEILLFCSSYTQKKNILQSAEKSLLSYFARTLS